MRNKVHIYTDGAARGNPGPAAIGIIMKDEAGKTIAEISDYIGEQTNNIAEYTALSRGLEEAVDMEIKYVEVYSDSELMVKQINGEYKVKNQGIMPLYLQVKSLIKQFDKFKIYHIDREENFEADLLANQALDKL